MERDKGERREIDRKIDRERERKRERGKEGNERERGGVQKREI